jgi:vacuolar-type H+-ATPase subunit C/Vma6
MKKLHQIAAFSPDRKIRERAIEKLAKKHDITGLVAVLESKYADAVEKAEMALAGYQFK